MDCMTSTAVQLRIMERSVGGVRCERRPSEVSEWLGRIEGGKSFWVREMTMTLLFRHGRRSHAMPSFTKSFMSIRIHDVKCNNFVNQCQHDGNRRVS